MKTTAKVFAIIAAALLCAGILLSVIGVLLGERGYGETPWEEVKENFSLHQISTIKTNIDNRSIIIEETTDNEIRVEYSTSEKNKVECSVSGSELSIDSVSAFRFFSFDWLYFPKKSTKVIISVPSSYKGSFDLDTSNASIQVNGFKSLKDVVLKSSNGKIEFKNASCETLSCKTTNSSITLSDVNCDGKVYTKSSNGTITLNNVSAKDEIETDTSNGRITFTNCSSDSDITATSSNGAIELENVVSQRLLYAKTSNGAIRISEIDGKTIRLKAGNSSIRGDVAGKMSDYSIISDTSNGKNNLPNGTKGSGGKTLDVKTSNGSIEITFAE